MDLLVLVVVLHLFHMFDINQGQCTSNGTCVCHCEDCTSGCVACLPGWTGSTINYCQRSNTFFRINAIDKLFDGDSNTYEKAESQDPFVRGQYNYSSKIDQLDITLIIENGIKYTVFVKKLEYTREDSEICSNFTYNNGSSKKTVTVTCNGSLQGKYIEIVASSSSITTLKVFEIERFECSHGTYGENCSKICSDGCNKQCDKKTGDCICKSGRWGNYCDRTCPSFCDKNTCNSDTGNCYSCSSGYYGVKCDKECSSGCEDSCNMTSGFCICKPGFYLTNCSLQCPTTCFNGECHQEKGTCLVCNDGTYGDLCDQKCLGDCNGQCHRRDGICGSCAMHKYGYYCNQSCPIYCESDVCKRDTGNCEKCKIGYMGDKCNKSCPEHCEHCDQNGYKCQKCVPKRYGVKCELMCPLECGGNGSCDIETSICNECPVGKFGKSCTQTCSEWCDTCDQITGQCQNCKAGRYGRDCLELCRTQCLNSACLSNQTCAYGCEDGWFGARCDFKCNAAILNCVKCYTADKAPVCSQCANQWYLKETNCIRCPENCSLCVSNEECLECKSNLYHGKTCHLTCNTACINQTCDITGNCKQGCDNSKYGKECDKDCLKHCKTCHNLTMCMECESGYFGESCQMCPEGCEKCEESSTCRHCEIGFINVKCLESTTTETNDPENTGISDLLNMSVVAILLLLVVMSSVIYLTVRQMKQKWKKRSRTTVKYIKELPLMRTGHFYENVGISIYKTRGSQALLEEIDPEEKSYDVDIDEIETYTCNYVNVNMTRISLKRLWEYKLQNTASDMINTEFKNLPTGFLSNCKEGKKPENKKRNRYKNIYPYDENRVLLSTDGENCDSSYINASYINGFEAPKEYIASQGPYTDETVTDFWRMVWKENINTIVILTNLEENGVKKCKKYWPSTEKMYGYIHVKILSSDTSVYFKVRRFQITLKNEVRTVEQFHFTAWPDKGVPSTVHSILDFRKNVRRKADITNPIIVHCSAGIGRTGTFIALDFLINQGQKEGSVDVVGCVTNLRYQRAHLVQTVEQYNYLYGAVTRHLTGKESGVQEKEFKKYYSHMKRFDQSTGKTFIAEEFNLIEKLVPDIDENRFQSAKAVNNRHKNRHSNILADDNFRIYINRLDGDYINAISLPGVQQNFAYIITHTPLPETVDDFFSMMADQEVRTIVQLDNDADEVFGNRCRSEKETLPQNSFELLPEEKTTFGNLELLTCHFQDDHALVSRTVKMYRGSLWNENCLVPNKFQPMISLVETILNRRKEQKENPVLVVCRDGAQRSGLFCVLANLVEQLQLSGSVDILQTVLNIRHRRPQIVPCLEQLEYIYDFIEKYLESGNKA